MLKVLCRWKELGLGADRDTQIVVLKELMGWEFWISCG
jgi:hypothetical protein